MMSERTAKKRAVNLFVDAELLDHARRLRIISETWNEASYAGARLEREWLRKTGRPSRT